MEETQTSPPSCRNHGTTERSLLYRWKDKRLNVCFHLVFLFFSPVGCVKMHFSLVFRQRGCRGRGGGGCLLVQSLGAVLSIVRAEGEEKTRTEVKIRSEQQSLQRVGFDVARFPF